MRPYFDRGELQSALFLKGYVIRNLNCFYIIFMCVGTTQNEYKEPSIKHSRVMSGDK